MASFKSLYDQTLFLLSTLTWFGVVDILLVTAAFYFLLSVIQRSSASYLIRELLVLGAGLFAITALLPLPVFDWLIQGVLVALLVATPIIFQAQLRRFIERVGRGAGIAKAARQDTVEKTLPEVVHAVEQMAASRTGALIVLEGAVALEEVIATGIAFSGRVVSEVLLSIFYPGTPLHDGAVVIRGDKIVAAGCLLPLTQQLLIAEKRLGTRHRAAVGLSEVSDALVVVVSEETGAIGVAAEGRLERPLTSAQLRERLVDFYDPAITRRPPSFSVWRALREVGGQVWRASSLAEPRLPLLSRVRFRQLVSQGGLLLFALLLALVVWSFVFQQNNTILKARVEGIPLQVLNLPVNTTLIPPPPGSVSALIQTTEEVLPTLSSQSFQATVLVQDVQPGQQVLPVRVSSGARQVLVLSVTPGLLEMNLTPMVSETLPILIEVVDADSLSTAYELTDPPDPRPDTVLVVGPGPYVAQVVAVKASISLPNAPTEVRETLTLQAVDEAGRRVPEVTLQPSEVQVTASIKGRSDTRDVSVRAVVSGAPPAEYQVSGISVTPSNVTLRSGNGAPLEAVGSFVETLPIEVEGVTSDLRVEIPLDLPEGAQALDGNGSPVSTVLVLVDVSVREGAMSLTRPVTLLGYESPLTGGSPSTLTLDPETVTLLLIGPQPILNEIERNPSLVRVAIDLSSLRVGGPDLPSPLTGTEASSPPQNWESAVLEPIISAPEEVEVEVVPDTIRATVQFAGG